MRSPWILISSLLIGLVLAFPSLAQTKTEQMDRMVSAYVANKHFMGSVLVAQGDNIIFNKSYGSANLEWDIPNTSATKFRLASVTKQFTAASILLLEQQGKLKNNRFD
jgi:CubicO group peptidase (beta-lactamase class C family)